jgi:hypothetical protein
MTRRHTLLGCLVLAILTAGCDAAGAPSAADGPPAPPPPPTTSAVDETVAAPGPPRAPGSWTDHTYRWDADVGGSSVTIPVPADWTMSQEGDRIDYRDPTRQLLLRLNLEQDLPGEPIDVFAKQEAEQSGQYSGYGKGGIDYALLGASPDQIDGATWDFQFTKDGVERGVIVAGFHPFGDEDGSWVTIYFSAPDEYWGDLSDTVFWNNATRFVLAG